MKTNRDFKGVWIPKEIWENQDLSLQEKVFYVEIDSLDNEDGCFASNEYFARFFGITTRQVQRVIASLIDKKLLSSEVNQHDGNVRTLRSLGHTLTTEMSLPLRQKSPTPNDENVVHNNTTNNTFNNIVREETPAEKARKFFTDLKEKTRVYDELILRGMQKSIAEHELAKFISYWTEPNKSGTKQRWELERTFELGRRLATWFRNYQGFNEKNKVSVIKI